MKKLLLLTFLTATLVGGFATLAFSTVTINLPNYHCLAADTCAGDQIACLQSGATEFSCAIQYNNCMYYCAG